MTSKTLFITSCLLMVSSIVTLKAFTSSPSAGWNILNIFVKELFSPMLSPCLALSRATFDSTHTHVCVYLGLNFLNWIQLIITYLAFLGHVQDNKYQVLTSCFSHVLPCLSKRNSMRTGKSSSQPLLLLHHRLCQYLVKRGSYFQPLIFTDLPVYKLVKVCTSTQWKYRFGHIFRDTLVWIGKMIASHWEILIKDFTSYQTFSGLDETEAMLGLSTVRSVNGFRNWDTQSASKNMKPFSLAISWQVVDLPAPGGPVSQKILPLFPGWGMMWGQLQIIKQ